MTAADPVTALERTLLSCKATGNFTPAWEQFVNTEFFVPVLQNDSGPQTKDFRFHILTNPQDQKPVLAISESLPRLARVNGVQAIKLRGGALLGMLHADVGILIALTDGIFGIPAELVRWLRSSTQSAAT